jgi:hypothetical protein
MAVLRELTRRVLFCTAVSLKTCLGIRFENAFRNQRTPHPFFDVSRDGISSHRDLQGL